MRCAVYTSCSSFITVSDHHHPQRQPAVLVLFTIILNASLPIWSCLPSSSTPVCRSGPVAVFHHPRCQPAEPFSPHRSGPVAVFHHPRCQPAEPFSPHRSAPVAVFHHPRCQPAEPFSPHRQAADCSRSRVISFIIHTCPLHLEL